MIVQSRVITIIVLSCFLKVSSNQSNQYPYNPSHNIHNIPREDQGFNNHQYSSTPFSSGNDSSILPNPLTRSNHESSQSSLVGQITSSLPNDQPNYLNSYSNYNNNQNVQNGRIDQRSSPLLNNNHYQQTSYNSQQDYFNQYDNANNLHRNDGYLPKNNIPQNAQQPQYPSNQNDKARDIHDNFIRPNSSIPNSDVIGKSNLFFGGDLSQVDKDVIFEGLKNLYRKKILPLEISSKYSHFSSPPLGPSDFDAKPMVLILGQYSVGKTSFIRSLLKQDFPGQRIGPGCKILHHLSNYFLLHLHTFELIYHYLIFCNKL